MQRWGEFWRTSADYIFQGCGHILKVLPVTFTPEEEEQFKKYHTKNLPAVINFGQGLDALDAGHWKDAKIFFKKSTEEDPGFELAKYYSDHCPGATVATINSLSGITAGQLASSVEDAVDEASSKRGPHSVIREWGLEKPESLHPLPEPYP